RAGPNPFQDPSPFPGRHRARSVPSPRPSIRRSRTCLRSDTIELPIARRCTCRCELRRACSHRVAVAWCRRTSGVKERGQFYSWVGRIVSILGRTIQLTTLEAKLQVPALAALSRLERLGAPIRMNHEELERVGVGIKEPADEIRLRKRREGEMDVASRHAV